MFHTRPSVVFRGAECLKLYVSDGEAGGLWSCLTVCLSRQPWSLQKKLLVDLCPLSPLLFLPTARSPVKNSSASVPLGEMLLLLVGELSIPL